MYFKHGHSKRPEYKCWQQIKARCYNPNVYAYPDYGGRGIGMYEGWLNDFEAFFAHVGPRPTPEHSLDRLDNDKNYEPGNIAWRTSKEQNNNRRPHRKHGLKIARVSTGRKTNFKHGMVHSPEYAAWIAMKDRCLNPKSDNYSYWGGRGITIYPEWASDFEAFYTYMGPKPTTQHSLDRIDNEKNYEPGNVKWSTKLEQTHNRRPLRTGSDHGNFDEGQTKSPLYKNWTSIKTRCFNKKTEKYKTYGGAGITMCQRWKDSSKAFIADMGEKPTPEHTIARLDHEGHYSCGQCEECQAKGWPMNCAWQTKTEQNRSRKVSERSGKLTLEKAEEIRRRANAGEHQGHLAKEFGIGYSLVGKIKKGLVWKSA